MLNLSFYGTNYKIAFILDHYKENSNLYIGMDDFNEGYPCPFGNLTVNLSVKCKENCGFVDVNNNPGLEEFIKKNKLGKPTGRIQSSGFVCFPEYEFDMDEVKKHLSEDVNEEDLEKDTEEDLDDFYSDHPEFYNDGYDEEKPYGPSMPWNAPGMKISDFI